MIVGGGYLGLWTAWQLPELEPASTGPARGRPSAATARAGATAASARRSGTDAASCATTPATTRALAVCRASEEAVHGIGGWCEAQGVDAWSARRPCSASRRRESRSAPGTRPSRPARARRGRGGRRPERRRGRRPRGSPLFLGGAALRLNATVHPARLALGLRARLLERGVRIHERTRGDAARAATGRRDAQREVRAGAAVLAVNHAAAGVPRLPAVARASPPATSCSPSRCPTSSRSSAGRAARRSSTAGRWCTTCARRGRADRVRLGRRRDGLRRAARGRLELDRQVIARDARAPRPLLPAAARTRASRTPGAGRSTSPPPTSRSSAAAAASTTASASPATASGRRYLGGEILARLALDRRDELTRLAIVEPDRKLFPPEPLRYAGGRSSGARCSRRTRPRTGGANRTPRPRSSPRSRAV